MDASCGHLLAGGENDHLIILFEVSSGGSESVTRLYEELFSLRSLGSKPATDVPMPSMSVGLQRPSSWPEGSLWSVS